MVIVEVITPPLFMIVILCCQHRAARSRASRRNVTRLAIKSSPRSSPLHSTQLSEKRDSVRRFVLLRSRRLPSAVNPAAIRRQVYLAGRGRHYFFSPIPSSRMQRTRCRLQIGRIRLPRTRERTGGSAILVFPRKIEIEFSEEGEVYLLSAIASRKANLLTNREIDRSISFVLSFSHSLCRISRQCAPRSAHYVIFAGMVGHVGNACVNEPADISRLSLSAQFGI